MSDTGWSILDTEWPMADGDEPRKKLLLRHLPPSIEKLVSCILYPLSL